MLTSETIRKLRSLRLFLLDMDGTIYCGNRLFEHTLRLFDILNRTGRLYRFMTNNSSKSVDAYIEKLHAMGIESTYEQYITSSQATAVYLHEHHPRDTFYVCGTRSLIREFESEGFAVTDNADEATCIVMGYDKELTYQKLDDICRTLCTRDIPYIATHPDTVCPTEYGSVPDCGAVCEMIEHATGKTPVFIGKPQPLMPLLAMKRAGISAAETATVGDRIYTDVMCGKNAGCTGILVLSGETTPAILAASPQKPDLVLQGIEEICDALENEC